MNRVIGEMTLCRRGMRDGLTSDLEVLAAYRVFVWVKTVPCWPIVKELGGDCDDAERDHESTWSRFE